MSGPSASRSGELLGDVLPWLGALALLVCVGALVVWAIRRWLGREPAPPEGFSLQELRRLHAAGALSDEEFERARRSVIGRVRGTEKEAGSETGGNL